MFVSRALAYITAAKSGLTESELEDILSCDDDVLEDVFQYWVPSLLSLIKLFLCFVFLLLSNVGKGRRVYNKAPTKEKLTKWGSLSREGDKIKFVDVRFKR